MLSCKKPYKLSKILYAKSIQMEIKIAKISKLIKIDDKFIKQNNQLLDKPIIFQKKNKQLKLFQD